VQLLCNRYFALITQKMITIEIDLTRPVIANSLVPITSARSLSFHPTATKGLDNSIGRREALLRQPGNPAIGIMIPVANGFEESQANTPFSAEKQSF
jgi:hypothetical protein